MGKEDQESQGGPEFLVDAAAVRRFRDVPGGLVMGGACSCPGVHVCRDQRLQGRLCLTEGEKHEGD